MIKNSIIICQHIDGFIDLSRSQRISLEKTKILLFQLEKKNQKIFQVHKIQVKIQIAH